MSDLIILHKINFEIVKLRVSNILRPYHISLRQTTINLAKPNQPELT